MKFLCVKQYFIEKYNSNAFQRKINKQFGEQWTTVERSVALSFNYMSGVVREIDWKPFQRRGVSFSL